MSTKKSTAKANFEKTTRDEAMIVGDQLVKELESLCDTVTVAGSIRQGKEMVGDLDIVVIPNRPIEQFTEDVKQIIEFEYGGSKKLFGMYKDRPINIFITNSDSYGACLYQCTGPALYNVHKRQLAKSKGYKLNEYGLFNRETNEKVAGHTEESIFEALGWSYREPNERKVPTWIANRNKQ